VEACVAATAAAAAAAVAITFVDECVAAAGAFAYSEVGGAVAVAGPGIELDAAEFVVSRVEVVPEMPVHQYASLTQLLEVYGHQLD
jgi:hypothetical protein